jgi:hypothetical protein
METRAQPTRRACSCASGSAERIRLEPLLDGGLMTHWNDYASALLRTAALGTFGSRLDLSLTCKTAAAQKAIAGTGLEPYVEGRGTRRALSTSGARSHSGRDFNFLDSGLRDAITSTGFGVR